MMDLKEIIKWFIPCFHILQDIFKLKDMRLTFICLFLLFNFRVGCADASLDVSGAKNVDSLVLNKLIKVNQSDVYGEERIFPVFTDGAVGRTFGRPFKKMMGALLPLVFQIGAASTWAVVAALVGIKTLAVTLLILKILLIAGAAKALSVAHQAVLDDIRRQKLQYPMYPHFDDNSINVKNYTVAKWVPEQKLGALFGSKGHGHHGGGGGWEPPHHHQQKEIHLHIHNGHHDSHHDTHEGYGPPGYGLSREDNPQSLETKNDVIDPYSSQVISLSGPQTIRTPFGKYVRVESNEPLPYAQQK